MGSKLKWEKVPKYRPVGHDPLRLRPKLDAWADYLLAKPPPKKARKRKQRRYGT